MKVSLKKFGIKFNKIIPIDEFFDKALYRPNVGYYASKIPFGSKGDFVTAPTISNLFSEMVAIWIISTWEKIGKPKQFNVVELGPGDGSLTKVLINTFKKFPQFNRATKIFLYEKSNFLKDIQRKKISNNKVNWIKNFDAIKKGPVIFFGNEFFDAIPIKQFSKNKNIYREKCYLVNKDGLQEIYRKASLKDISQIKKFRILNNLTFIEYPKLGFLELDKIVKKISSLSGGILLIDYGNLNNSNQNTLQSVMKNKRLSMNSILKNLGRVDVTSLVNFGLLKEYFRKKKLNVTKIVSQKYFLEKMGIIERAKILQKKMNSTQLEYMSYTLMRLLHKNSMGELFKVVFAYKYKRKKFLGF